MATEHRPPNVSLSLCRVCGKSSEQTKLRRCATCKAACYCSEGCQRADWPSHRAHCRTPDPAKIEAFRQWAKQPPMRLSCSFCGRKLRGGVESVAYCTREWVIVCCYPCAGHLDVCVSLLPRLCVTCGGPVKDDSHLLSIKFEGIRMLSHKACCSEACREEIFGEVILEMPDPRALRGFTFDKKQAPPSEGQRGESPDAPGAK